MLGELTIIMWLKAIAQAGQVYDPNTWCNGYALNRTAQDVHCSNRF